MANTTTCLQTKVRNITSHTLRFSFLPPHGKKLEPGEEYSFDGEPFETMWRNKRKRDAFKSALLDGLLVIVHTPQVQVYDATLDQTVGLDVVNNVVTAVTPCWGHYKSSAISA